MKKFLRLLCLVTLAAGIAACAPLQAQVAQSPFIVYANKMLNGEKMPANTYVDVILVTKNTLK